MAKEFNIARPTEQCRGCDKRMQPREEFLATVREVEEEFVREDFCLGCWEQRAKDPDGAVFGVWRARVTMPQEKKKKLLVDDGLLVNFFERLEGADSPAKISYRFVLALVLMRKKLLVYERMGKNADGLDVWVMRLKGAEQTYDVVDPHMDEDKIAEVSHQLGDIMQGEFE